MKKTVSLVILIVILLSLGSVAFANNETHYPVSIQRIVDFIWPTKSRTINSPYGWRIHPIHEDLRFHSGIDIARITNSDPIWSASDGVVVYSGYYGDYGNLVIVNYNWQGIIIQTRYAHLASRSVSTNQRVYQGTNIGVMGTTGASTGIHLHYEVREANSMNSIFDGTTTMDPVTFHDFIDSGGGTNSIKDLITAGSDDERDVKVGLSDDGFGISIRDRFLSLDYILNTPVDKLQLLGLTAGDVSLLIENNIVKISSTDVNELMKLKDLIENR